jgi:hypothetical protein
VGICRSAKFSIFFDFFMSTESFDVHGTFGRQAPITAKCAAHLAVGRRRNMVTPARHCVAVPLSQDEPETIVGSKREIFDQQARV